jgi:hypothetical protein
MGRLGQQKRVEIDRGLFLVRYATAEDTERPPKVTVRTEHGAEEDASFVLHPDSDEAVLWEPGACVVVRATAPATLAVEVEPLRDAGSAAASVRIEPLTQGKRPAASLQPRNDAVRSRHLHVLGHVASIGDVVVKAGEWLAGPTAPSRIEGLSISWPDKPDDVEIRYSVTTSKGQTISGRTAEQGTFAGTRARALPIVSLTLELSGPGAANAQFDIEAVFLGSPLMRRTGARIALSGPTGREPLVGLKVGVESLSSASRAQGIPAAARVSTGAGRVRVFRSRPKQDQPATF